MNLDATIERHRRQLIRIVATLFAMIGVAEGGTAGRLSPSLYRAVVRVLRPAESAVRRLIVVMAQGLAVKPPRARTAAKSRIASRKQRRSAPFKLFDPRQRFVSAFDNERPRHRITLVKRPEPCLRVLDVGFDPRVPLFRQARPVMAEPPPQPDGSRNATRLCRRLAAIKSALDDLPRQARRYARWQAKPAALRRPRFSSALRPGLPPGHRKNPLHKVDEILAACDGLARHSLQPDTS